MIYCHSCLSIISDNLPKDYATVRLTDIISASLFAIRNRGAKPTVQSPQLHTHGP